MTEARTVHLIGICGTAMASLAGLLREKGLAVTGSDAAAYPPMSDQLAEMGIPVMEPYAAANLDGNPDLVVVGNAISRGNPEVERVLNERMRFTSMAEILRQEFLETRETLVVAGTHGKTTTTSMLAWIYQTAAASAAEYEPSFLIGGVAENFATSYQLRPTSRFVLEGDEYDTAFFDKGPKFLHYFPLRLILTSVEFDHADIYADLEQVKTAFKRLVNLVPGRGRIVAWDGSANVTECVVRAFCPVERYGFTEGADWQIRGLRFEAGRSRWQVWREGALWAELEMAVAGEHNVLNATAAAALAAGDGVPVESIQAGLASFLSVKRRLEVKAQVAGITVIDDFAHHPTAIRETLKALRQAWPGQRLWAVLEPRSNTLRRNVFKREVAEALAGADRVLMAGVFQMERIPVEERLHPEDVVALVNEAGVPAKLLADVDAIVRELTAEAKAGDVIAILSNGGFGGIYQKLPAALGARAAEVAG